MAFAPARFGRAGVKVTRFHCRGLVLTLVWVLAVFAPVEAAEAVRETMAERTLRRIVEHQKEIFADAERQGEKRTCPRFASNSSA